MSRSQFHSIKLFILRHAWLNLWDKHMTTGRINQVTFLSNKKQRPHWALTQRATSISCSSLFGLRPRRDELTRSHHLFCNRWFFQFSTGCRERKHNNRKNWVSQRAFFWTSLDGERMHRIPQSRTCHPSSQTVEFYVCPAGKHTNCNVSSSTTTICHALPFIENHTFTPPPCKQGQRTA